MRRFPRKFTTRYAKDLLYYANLHCRFGTESTERCPDDADKAAANILHNLFRILLRSRIP